MQTERITSTSHPDWPWLWNVYMASFPAGERRKIDGQEAIAGNPRYFCELWRNDEGIPVGFTACWIYERFRFLEHFAVDSERRNGGYGKTILLEWMRRPGPVVILEIDPPKDEISRRRHGFYRRLGYCDNPGIKHSHPSYQDGKGIVPLNLLSYPEPIDGELYGEFIRCVNEEILAHLRLE